MKTEDFIVREYLYPNLLKCCDCIHSHEGDFNGYICKHDKSKRVNIITGSVSYTNCCYMRGEGNECAGGKLGLHKDQEKRNIKKHKEEMTKRFWKLLFT